MTPKNLLIYYTNNFKIVQFVNIYLSQLKDELRKRKARISGRKHELIER
jgi:hypothetical protein